tara:strand:- start:105 stop:2273 length:2169 start_codon:yes stop_codon:yes gene_type:complete
MLNFQNISDIKIKYSSGNTNLLKGFYQPVLEQSFKFDRVSGYFSGGVQECLEGEFLEFHKRGGKMRLICSTELSQNQLDNIQKGYDIQKQMENSIEENLETLQSDDLGKAKMAIITKLVALSTLEIKIALVKPNKDTFNDGHAILHDKCGVFQDSSSQQIAFSGSCNETKNGWINNHESFHVFKSWTHPENKDRCEEELRDFEALWNNEESQAVVIDFPEFMKLKLNRRYEQIQTIEDAYEQYRKQLPENNSSHGTTSNHHKTPHPHQKEAVEAWVQNDHLGIFAHCTGSGKTFSAILAMKKWFNTNPDSSVLILVPTIDLVTQWTAEIHDALAALDVEAHTRSFSSNPNHKYNATDVELYTKPSTMNTIAITTIAGAVSPNFKNQIHEGSHLMIIADEVHNLGSTSNQQLLALNTGARLGLSATPVRHRDPDGTEAILNYFGRVVSEIDIAQGIEKGILCEYYYHPQIVRLNASERTKFLELSLEISKETGKQYGLFGSEDVVNPTTASSKLKILYIQRADIGKNAASKVPHSSSVVSQYYKKGQSWLVFCDDEAQLEQVWGSINSLEPETKVSPKKYHSKLSNQIKATNLNGLKNFGGILIAINCLDEGIDIPSVDNALILASSSNPRQFIQRRGRVLRQSKATNKNFAHIHDVLVLPNPEDLTDLNFKSLITSEISRAYNFALSANNSDSAIDMLANEANKLNIDITDLIEDDTGYEED